MAGGGHGGHPLQTHLHPGKPITFYFDVLKRWSPSLMRFGAFSGCMFLYFTDWKIFMDKVPFYNTKFEEKEPIV